MFIIKNNMPVVWNSSGDRLCPFFDNGVFLDGRDKTLASHGFHFRKRLKRLHKKVEKKKLLRSKAYHYSKALKNGSGGRFMREWVLSEPFLKHLI